MAESKQKILAVVGPTASGKSSLAIRLAQELGGEIVSCDSMQIYRDMNIGTAKPTEEELQAVKHHLIDVVPPEQSFSCADYVQHAKQAIDEISARGALPILCGGTGLYLDALLRGGFDEDAEAFPELRQKLLDYAAEHGNHALHERLRAIDPESAEKIHENNVKRVARAIEIFEATGKTKTETDRLSRIPESPYDATVISLSYQPRSLLYDRIDKRVDQMIGDGLIEETRSLIERDVFSRNGTAAQAIGYKELFPYLRGEEPLETSVDRLKTATRHYAKRQLTWFGAKDYVTWLEMTRDGQVKAPEEILREALEIWFSRSDLAH